MLALIYLHFAVGMSMDLASAARGFESRVQHAYAFVFEAISRSMDQLMIE